MFMQRLLVTSVLQNICIVFSILLSLLHFGLLTIYYQRISSTVTLTQQTEMVVAFLPLASAVWRNKTVRYRQCNTCPATLLDTRTIPNRSSWPFDSTKMHDLATEYMTVSHLHVRDEKKHFLEMTSLGSCDSQQRFMFQLDSTWIMYVYIAFFVNKRVHKRRNSQTLIQKKNILFLKVCPFFYRTTWNIRTYFLEEEA